MEYNICIAFLLTFCLYLSGDAAQTDLTPENTTNIMEIQGQAANKQTWTWPQESDDITTDYRKLLEEGYVYRNEVLVASRPNSAYFELRQFTALIIFNQELQWSTLLLY